MIFRGQLLIFLLLSIVPLISANTQLFRFEDIDPVKEKWRWRQEKALEGLGVMCMTVAKDDSIWFGNSGGVAHYDGLNLEVIDFDEELRQKICDQETDPRAIALHLLEDNSLLVMIEDSLVHYKDKIWKVLIKKSGVSGYKAEIKQDSKGTIWIQTQKYLWRISKNLELIEKVYESTTKRGLTTLCIDAEDQIFMVEMGEASSSSLICLSGHDKKMTKSHYPLPVVTIAEKANLTLGADQTLWYADDDKNVPLLKFELQKKVWHQVENMNIKMRFLSLNSASDGTIWGGGLRKLYQRTLDGEEFFYDLSLMGIPHASTFVAAWSQNRMWVLGRVGYVYSVDLSEDVWKSYKDLHYQCEDKEGLQWFTSKKSGEVVTYNPSEDQWLSHRPESGLIDSINDIYISSHGLVWASGSDKNRAAFSVYNGAKWKMFHHPDFAERINPKSIFEMSDGSMWFGAGGVVLKHLEPAGGALQYIVDKNLEVKFKQHIYPPNFPYYITSFAESSDGVLAIGSTRLFELKQGEDKPGDEVNLQGLSTMDVLYDQQDSLWVAKEHGGLYRRKDGEWTKFTTLDGLAGIDLSDLCLLKDGSLVAATGSGISRFDGKSWTTYAFPSGWEMYDKRCKVQESQDGSLWFNVIYHQKESEYGTYSRQMLSIRFRPPKISPDTHIVQWQEEVSAPGNHLVSWESKLPWSYVPSSHIQYSWRLNEGDWSAYSHGLSKTLLNLDSGDYQLEVRARDPYFNVDPSPATIRFKVLPPIWQQAWFILLLCGFIAIIMSLVYVILRNRWAYLRRQQRERESYLLQVQEEKERHYEEVIRLKTGFMTNVSHELRTPITVIAGRLELLLKRNPDSELKKIYNIIKRNTQHLSNLVSQLLDFRKIEEGEIKVETTYGDLVPVFREWMSSMSALAEEKNISFYLHTLESCVGEFDLDKLQKICSNLVVNAIKYTPSGGQVQVRLLLSENGEQLLFSVEDTGIGVAKEHLDQIFNRFYRVPEASMAFGAGLGLNFSKELVDLLGGSISAESPIHKDISQPGARFTVEIPIMNFQERSTEGEVVPDQKHEETVEAEVLNSSEQRELILVIEDEADIRDILVEGLKKRYQIQCASDGQEGLKLAKEMVPDLIVSDIMMPGMDGLELCRQLKTSRACSHIPLIMLTAKTSMEHQRTGLQHGADDYITKPFDLELLQLKIQNMLQSRKAWREKFCQDFSIKITENPSDQLEKEFLENSIAMLEEHFSEKSFSPEVFAKKHNMSLRSLHRKLKAVANQTPKEFINAFRMKKASEYLLTSDKSIFEITFLVGMDEPTNFSRLFKSHFDVPPSTFREKHQN